MTDYRLAWLDLIAGRDNYYLLALLAALGALVWYKSHRRFFEFYLAAACTVVSIGLWWGLWHMFTH